MSDSNRGILAALAGIAALFVATGSGAYYGSLYGPAKKQYAAVDANQSSGEAYQGVTESLPDIALIPDPVERAIANPQPKSGQDHEKRDLAAQESMAVWAFYMAIFAGATALITGAGTYFIAAQVKLTREAVEDTNRATNAMERQSRLMQSAQRAWVVVEPEILQLSVDKDGVSGVYFAIHFRNNGKTVACKVGHGGAVLVVNEDNIQAEATRLYEFWRGASENGNGNIMPTERLSITIGTGGGPIVDREPAKQFILVGAHAIYQLESSDDWHETIRFFIAGRPGIVTHLPDRITEHDAGRLSVQNLQISQYWPSLTT